MGLSEYKKKRKFEQTPEPESGNAKGKELHFVIQKHDASHLHYDFRLEMEGVLKSWAVPKGPSLNPKTKRLAMMVEDHPYSYKDFEGVIPEGNYGAGTVIVWDKGTYEPIDDSGKDKKAQEKILLTQLKSGSLKIKMKGEKLKGEFALVKTKGMGENAWLLIKHNDDYASTSDILKKDKSVISDRRLTDLDKEKENSKGEKPKPRSAKIVTTKKEIKKKIKAKTRADSEEESDSVIDVDQILKRAKKQKFPSLLKPMLATLVDEPFDDDDWEFEVKWDGYRAVSFLNCDKVEIKSRNNKSFNDKYYPIVNALQNWNQKIVVDGEIVVVNEKGISEFNSLQNWRSEADGQLMYYIFDLLWMNGKSLLELPLSDRKHLLQSIIPNSGIIKTGFTIREKGIAFFETADKMGLEGIIAKKSSGKYYPGNRSKEWLKIKAILNQEVVICGFTKNEDTSKLFSSLLLGTFEMDKLNYSGKVGTGFTDQQQQDLMKLFKPLIIKNSPFEVEPDYNKPSRFRPAPPNAKVTWLKPELVAVIKFTEITEDGLFRHPSFISLRTDKKAKEVKAEKKEDTKQAIHAKEGALLTDKVLEIPKASGRNTLLNPTEETQVKKINGISLKFTNLSKVFWPEEGYTKRDLLNYYYQVASYILPYLKNRPQSLNRFPNGIKGKSFYQKNISGKSPDWLHTMPYTSNEEKGINKNFLVGYDEASLLYMVNLGAIEMNPWSSTVENPDHPDWCILDLDSGEKSSFEDVILTAQAIKRKLDILGISAYPKTSGSTGIHIYIPLGAQYTYDQSQLFAKWIAAQVEAELPNITSIERIVKARKGKLYIDYLQNRPQATLAAPYSVRPKPGATVSMPLHWEEVKNGLKISDFTIKNAIKRIKKEGDIFRPVLEKGIDIKRILTHI